MWVYLIIALICIYALYKERQALGCPKLPSTDDCNNKNGKAIRGSEPYIYDSNSNICSKLKLAGAYNDRFVFWRLSLLVSLVSSVLLWFVLYRRFPTEWELVVSMIVISSVVYFTQNFYKFHLSDYAKKNIYEAVDILRQRGSC